LFLLLFFHFTYFTYFIFNSFLKNNSRNFEKYFQIPFIKIFYKNNFDKKYKKKNKNKKPFIFLSDALLNKL